MPGPQEQKPLVDFLFWNLPVFISPVLIYSVSIILCYFIVAPLNHVQDIRSSSSQSTLYTTNLFSHLKKPLFTRFSYSEAFHGSPLLVFKALLKLALWLFPPLINWLLQPNWSVVHSGMYLILIPWPQPLLVLQGGIETHIPHKTTHAWRELFILLHYVAEVQSHSHSAQVLPEKGKTFPGYGS